MKYKNEIQNHFGQKFRTLDDVSAHVLQLAEERQREHDLRVKIAGELETVTDLLLDACDVLDAALEGDFDAGKQNKAERILIRVAQAVTGTNPPLA